MRLVLVGISHHAAPVEVRERVALRPDAAATLAAELASDGTETVCLSTCNRTEIYLAADDAAEAERRAVDALAAAGEDVEAALYRLHDGAAVLHLFRVAAGLDSLVPGEGEILGQVRAAHEVSRPGPLLDRAFEHALHVGRKVRAQTAIGESPASVPAAGAALAQQVFGELDGREVLVVGAGKVSELAARNLVSRGARIVAVANRSEERAAGLAERFGAESLPLAGIGGLLERVDVVVCSTGAAETVVGRAAVAAALPARRGRALFLVDLAVPRDVDPEVGGLEGCYLFDIDDLQAVVAETLAGRRREAERAEALVGAAAERFSVWLASRDVAPAIASLRARAEAIRAAELEKAESRLARLSETERRAVESVTAQIVNKLLHLPTVRMKQAAVTADGVLYADAVRHLFGLGEEER